MCMWRFMVYQLCLIWGCMMKRGGENTAYRSVRTLNVHNYHRKSNRQKIWWRWTPTILLDKLIPFYIQCWNAERKYRHADLKMAGIWGLKPDSTQRINQKYRVTSWAIPSICKQRQGPETCRFENKMCESSTLLVTNTFWMKENMTKGLPLSSFVTKILKISASVN